ncbi:formate/nitrite transporter family protein [Escherichia coli]
MALLWSAIAAVLSIGRFILGKRDISCRTGRCAGQLLAGESRLCLGFIIVIIGQQLFTENTVTAVLPVMQKPTMSNVGLLMRLWGVVLLGNIVGTSIAAWAFDLCRYLMKKLAMHLSKSAWM